MRVLVWTVLIALLATSSADADRRRRKPATTAKAKKDKKSKKDEKPAPAPRAPGPHDAEVKKLLDSIVTATGTERDRLVKKLDALAGKAVPAIGEWLQREHEFDDALRRKVLEDIHADVPDKKGRFTPTRVTKKEQQADEQVDWLASLDKADPHDGATGEVYADVAAIRALAASKKVEAAQVIFDTAFGDTMLYRDECGRYLRKMEPYSIPALTFESKSRKRDRHRYANWQLERLDRQEPEKALSAATGDEQLQAAILGVFLETHHREAVHAVWAYVDNNSPLVRAAARRTWMGYITGPAPRPAPRHKLKLPGGKLTKKPKPLWLTYRELADNELRKAANELLHEDYKIAEQGIGDDDPKVRIEPIDQVEVTKRLFAYFDGERAKHDAAQWQAAKAKSDKGDLAGAATMLDQLVAQTPDRKERTQMAAIYASYGKQLENASKWSEAAAAYSKAYGLDPQQSSLAAHHYALGKALETKGKDGGPDYRAAVALDPSYAPARQAADRIESAHSRPIWMLYAAVGAGLLAMLLFGAAMLRRRAS